MENIAIENPIVVQSEEVTYDKWWVKNLRINANDPNKSVKIVATIAPVATVSGVKLLLESEEQKIIIEDAFVEASKNQNVANAMGAIFTAIFDYIQ